ncbi:HAD family hydrolase [Halomicroarcula sp. GCM10025324]|jgi:HAD superfamily hydrolase (TIGR01549 family)|uniref:HAD family hydrolase n=1 Tax=Haloarcula TaxID=2237 RepID=UPI0023E7C079|nr:HAD family hydrolase [Halomicroarcula sp. ZS-22-S1]
MSYDSVIFDNDGVLLTLTGMDAHRDGAREAFARVGVDAPDPDHVEAMSIGVSVPRLESVCAHYDVDPARFWRARDAAISAAQRAAMTAGEKHPYDDIDRLDALSVPLGVVSSNQQATVDFAFDHFGLASRFETVRAREPTIESLRLKKPHPHYVEAALDDLGVDDALFVGDNESDVEAAHRAGIDAAFIRRPHRVDADLDVDPEYDVWGLEDVVRIAE